MTNCSTNDILIKPITLTQSEFLAFKKAASKLNWAIFLESAQTDHADSRWSIYSAQPIATIETVSAISTVTQHALISTTTDDPFSVVETLRKALFQPVCNSHELPFTGGALGYFSYELGYQLEKINHATDPSGLDLPEMAIGFYDWALLKDNHNDRFYLVIHKSKQSNENTQTLWAKRSAWIKQHEQALLVNKANQQNNFKLTSSWSANMDKQAYQTKFTSVQNYILSGDCYQVNLAQRFNATYQGDEYQAYQAVFIDNRPPFAAFFRLPKQVILSLSPERFIKLHNGIVESKPIKGTRPRFDDHQADQLSSQALLNSEKDRAENLMIVDLLRNDIGRVCQSGSVSVPKLFTIESFPAVHHLVSTVLGKLANKYSSEDLLRACFPGGSITGTPKIRAMEIIAELEPHKRQLYCGSIAYINSDGSMDSNICIRTLLCHQNSIYCWAGGGLVADSDVHQEYQECFDKVSKILPCLAEINQQLE
ncbi:aminodeoxychorismate synthase component I [Psychromonas sp. MME2]|uniref:aminodeoxychorismate synthase component I n=1 Tax=Psychromonas sp. MME2 TaxID=3231033 RepID=UPI00339BC568